VPAGDDGQELAAGYIARWRPSSVSPRAAAFARDVITAVGPGGQERAKNLLWTAGKLADYAIGLGLDLVPEVVLHPSVAERFTRCAPGLSGVARRTLRANLRFIGRRVVPHLYPADLPLPRERAKKPYSPAQIGGFLALADAQPTMERRMRAAGLVCLGAGAGLIRGDLRDARGSDVTCRSGGVVVTVRGARPRAVPVLARYHARLLAAARSAGTALICGGSDPGRRNITNPLISALDGGGGLPRLDTSRLRATWLADCADLPVRPPRSCTRPGSAAPSAWVISSPAWSRPARRTRSGCPGPSGDDPAGGVRADHRRLRRRAAD
jgi:integrase